LEFEIIGLAAGCSEFGEEPLAHLRALTSTA